ncbi:outer membrane lipoprotein carrier protein LolA [Porphyromonas endodontalis]|uniref:LolA family protein n=1 Tax=Porphyromonas endodontalis TaxID=28124 RepID=UPI002889C7E2|nr:outer membrane lipoprotein carrier protein LolA [Porphyromonas endodontalis]
MKTKRIALWVALLVFVGCMLPSVATAQTKQPSAQSLINTMAQRLEKGAKITFSGELFDASGVRIETKKGVLYTLGKKFRVRYNSIDTNYNGRELSFYNAEDRTYTIMHPSMEDLAALNPFVFLSSSASVYNIKELSGTKTSRIIAFTLRKKMENITSLEVSFLRKTNAPSQIVGIFADGMRLVINITSIEGETPSSQMFIQQQSSYPGSELVDLR